MGNISGQLYEIDSSSVSFEKSVGFLDELGFQVTAGSCFLGSCN